ISHPTACTREAQAPKGVNECPGRAASPIHAFLRASIELKQANAARRKHSEHLADVRVNQTFFRQMLKHQIAENENHPSRRNSAQIASISLLPLNSIIFSLQGLGLFQHFFRDIEPDDMAKFRGEASGHPPRAATELQHRLALRCEGLALQDRGYKAFVILFAGLPE